MPKLAEKFISDNGANIYDKVKITNKEQTLEGIIMPRNNFSGDHIIVLKLDNGYNIGISAEGAELNIIEKAKEKPKNKLKNEKVFWINIVNKGNKLITIGLFETSFSPIIFVFQRLSCEIKSFDP